MTETRNDVPNFEGLYQARPGGDPDCRVRAIDHRVDQGSRWGHKVANTHHGRILKPFTTPNGQKRVVLHDAAHRRHARYVDVIVAETFGSAS